MIAHNLFGYSSVDNVWSGLTTFLVALVGVFSAENLLGVLGLALLVVRLIYESIRLIRFVRDKKGVDY